MSQWWELAFQPDRSEHDIAAQVATWLLGWLVLFLILVIYNCCNKIGHRAAATVRIIIIIILFNIYIYIYYQLNKSKDLPIFTQSMVSLHRW